MKAPITNKQLFEALYARFPEIFSMLSDRPEMSLHKTQLTAPERECLVKHGLKCDEPSQLSDSFRLGFKAAIELACVSLGEDEWFVEDTHERMQHNARIRRRIVKLKGLTSL